MIIKLSSSLKAVQVISDDGTVFQTSIFMLKKLIEDANPAKFSVLTEMSYKVAANRFPKSPVYEGATTLDLSKYDPSRNQSDAFSNSHKVKQEQERVVDDSVAWQ